MAELNKTISETVSQVISQHKDMKKNGHTEYLSWEYCYSAFAKYQGENISEEDLDYLSLHLSFYLASWGMYRASSFLKSYDYKVHYEAIRELLKEEYISLWAIKCSDYNGEQEKLLSTLVENLKEIYKGIRGKKIKSGISDTLISKILMGTLGCTPGYDTYFRAGIKKYEITPASLGSTSINNIMAFYMKHHCELERIQKHMSVTVQYPQMRVIDMFFFWAGH